MTSSLRADGEVRVKRAWPPSRSQATPSAWHFPQYPQTGTTCGIYWTDTQSMTADGRPKGPKPVEGSIAHHQLPFE